MDVKFAPIFVILVNYLSMVLSKLELRLLSHHTALEGSTFLTLHGISLQECWNNCESRRLCGSINYRRMMHLCQLNNGYHDSESFLKATVVKKGSVFYRKDEADWTKTQCDSINCPYRSVCDENTATCSVRECLPLPGSDSHSVSGNMVSVGDKMLQRCSNGFVPALGTSATVTSECGENGEWSNNINCQKQLVCCDLACTMRPSATSLKLFQVLEHGVWKDRPCAEGTIFYPVKCICNWPLNIP